MAKTIGMADVACFASDHCAARRVTMTSTLRPDELGRDLGIALLASLRPAILDRDGAALDPAEFAQPLHQGGEPSAARCRRAGDQKPDGRQLARLLRAGGERPNRGRGSRAAEQRDESRAVSFDHLVGARAGTLGGTFSPSALAVVRLIRQIELGRLLDRRCRRASLRAESCRPCRRRAGTGPGSSVHRTSGLRPRRIRANC